MRALLATVVLLAGTPAMAMQAAPSAAEQQQLDSYLCTFVNKCANGTGGAEPTKAAPELRGFRIMGSTGTTGPVAGAGVGGGVETRRIARSPRMARTTQRRYPVGSRQYTAAARPTLTPGATAAVSPPRADLMLPFGYNSAELTPAAAARARVFAKALMLDDLKAKRFMIEGHTDSRGSRPFNIDLSRRRAQAVADYLIAQGVDRTRVQVNGVGPDQPLPGHSAKAEANRRVEAVLVAS